VAEDHRFDDRWRWLVTSVVPQFRRFDADTRLVDASLRHIFDEARDFASTPCLLPRSSADGLGELRNRGYGTGHARRVNGSAFGLGTPHWRLWSNHPESL
jgi:hypothetical protein